MSALKADPEPVGTNFAQASQVKLTALWGSIAPKVTETLNGPPLRSADQAQLTTTDRADARQGPTPSMTSIFKHALVEQAVNIGSQVQAGVSFIKNLGHWGQAVPGVLARSAPFTVMGGGLDWFDLHATKAILNSRGLTAEHDIARLSKAENFSIDTRGPNAVPQVVVNKPTRRMAEASAVIDGFVSGVKRLAADPGGTVADIITAQALDMAQAMEFRAQGRIKEAADIEVGMMLSAVPLVGTFWGAGKAVDGLNNVARRGAPIPTEKSFWFLSASTPLVRRLDQVFDPVLNRIPRPKRISSAPQQQPTQPWFHFGVRKKKADAHESSAQPPSFMETVRHGAGVTALGATAYSLSSGNIHVHINTDLPYRSFNAPKYSNNIAIQFGDSGAFLMAWSQLMDHRPPWGLGLDNSTLPYWRGNQVSVMPRASLWEVGGGGLFMAKGYIPGTNAQAQATNVAGVGAFGALRFFNLTNRFALNVEGGKGSPFKSIVGELFASPLGVTFQPWYMLGPLAGNRRGVDINQLATYKVPLKKGGGGAHIEFEDAYQRKQRAAATGTLNPGWSELAIQDSEPNFTIKLTNLFSDAPMAQHVKKEVPAADLPHVRIAADGSLHGLQEGEVPFVLADGEIRVLSAEDLEALHGGQAIATLGQTALLLEAQPQARDFSLQRDRVIVQRGGQIARLDDKKVVVLDTTGKAWAVDAERLLSVQGGIPPERLGGEPAFLVKSKVPAF